MCAIASLGALVHPHVVWRPSMYHHHLCHFYQFVDPNLEAQYVQHSTPVWQTILRIHCLVVFLFSIQQFSEHLNAPDSPPFWTLFSVCATALVLPFVSCWRGTLPYSLPIHVLSVCWLCGINVYHLRLISASLDTKTMSTIFANVQPGTVDPIVASRVGGMVQWLVGQITLRDRLLNCCVPWVSLCVAGYNRWTLLAYASLFVSSIIGIYENPLVSEKAIGVFLLTVCTFAFTLVSLFTEQVRRSDFLAQTQLSRELQASQLADSVLNHMLKNVLADVAANAEMFLAGELGSEVLEDAVVCLRRGIRSCRQRMVYLKMVAGEYAPVRNAVNLKEFGLQLVAGRNVTTHFLDCNVLMDGTLMQLILENALSNAFKHGHPEHPGVHVTIRHDGPQDARGIPAGRQVVSFTVRNVAHPLRPKLTDEMAQTLFCGKASPAPGSVLPTLSDGIGLLHCGLAARLGSIALSLRQEGDMVMFTATVEADVPERAVRRNPEDDLFSLTNLFPTGLKIFCLDDSAAARRLLGFHLRKGCPSAQVRTYGAVEDEVRLFLAEALTEADIVVLDQILEYSHTHYGSDLCQQLVGHGFRGLVCIRSSDDSPDDQARYAVSGAHCTFGKDIPGTLLVQRLKAAYVQHSTRLLEADRPDHPPPNPLPRCLPSHSPPPALVWEI